MFCEIPERNRGPDIEMAPTTLMMLAEERSLPAKFVRDEDERPKVAYNQFSNDVPVISLAGIDEVDGRRGEICRKIVEACEEWGIFQVVDHGVDGKMIGEMYSLSREFFVLPAEEKLRYDMTGGKKGGFLVSSHLQVAFRSKHLCCCLDCSGYCVFHYSCCCWWRSLVRVYV